MVAGFAFKVSSVPFQFWAPGHLRGRARAGGRVPVGRVEGGGVRRPAPADVRGVPAPADFWAPIFAVLSLLTMTLGNLVAIQQRQVVRLLAYSSIAQAGYMLLPFALAGGTAYARQPRRRSPPRCCTS